MTQINSYFQQNTALQTVRLLFGAQTSSASSTSGEPDASTRITEIIQQSTALQTVRPLFRAQTSIASTASAEQDASTGITEITTKKVSVSPAFHDVLLSFAVEAGQAVARSKVEGSFNYDPGVELYKEWGSWTADQKREFNDWVSQQGREYISIYGAESAEYRDFIQSTRTVWNENDLDRAQHEYEVAKRTISTYSDILSKGYIEKNVVVEREDGSRVVQRGADGKFLVERIAITDEHRAFYQERMAPSEKIVAEYPAKMEDLISKFKYTYSANGSYSGLRMSGEPMVKNADGEYEWGQFKIYNAVTGHLSQELRPDGVLVNYDNSDGVRYERQLR
ncbi:hypothetical protein I6F26_14210 [Ensifer sp. IC3342]|nr:hypothetical protein [Ensifer sp. BRP08]MCA1447732.1 hypothetical protein [Ensifer sp. IC3342]